MILFGEKWQLDSIYKALKCTTPVSLDVNDPAGRRCVVETETDDKATILGALGVAGYALVKRIGPVPVFDVVASRPYAGSKQVISTDGVKFMDGLKAQMEEQNRGG